MQYEQHVVFFDLQYRMLNLDRAVEVHTRHLNQLLQRSNNVLRQQLSRSSPYITLSRQQLWKHDAVF